MAFEPQQISDQLPQELDDQPQWVRDVTSLYGKFDDDTAKLLSELYDENIVFKDPLHEMRGLDQVTDYFAHIGSGLLYCDFKFYRSAYTEHCAWIKWAMHFAHPRLNNGEEIVLQGATELVRTDKIVSHIDYYDLGAMLYENVPVLGYVTKKLKNRLVPV